MGYIKSRGQRFGGYRRLGDTGSTVPYMTAYQLSYDAPWYATLFGPLGTGAYIAYEAGADIAAIPGSVEPANLTAGTLTPAQVASVQQQGDAQILEVPNNAAAFGYPPNVVDVAQTTADQQIQGFNADLAALNPTSDPLLNATGIAWYWWAVAAAGLYLFTR